MPITANGQTYSDDQIKGFFANNPDNASVAKQAQSLGFNADQIQQAGQIAGKNWTTADVTGAAQGMGYNFGGANGAIINGNPPSSSSTTSAATPASAPGGMTIANTYYSPDQIKQFYANGGNDRQFVQQAGITDLDQQRQLELQARQIYGNYATGDAGLQKAYQQYQQTNPNGAWKGNYAGWLNDIKNGAPSEYLAMTTGQYTGAATAPTDFGYGGIYGPGTGHDVSYANSGQGMLGIGDGWGAAPGAAGTPGSTGAIINGGTGSTTSGSTGTTTGGSGSSGGNLGPSTWSVTPNQTVQGQITAINDPNNPLMQQARTQALEQMNDRGLTNSSMAQTAGQAAALNVALPIAQADASINANAAQTNNAFANQFLTAKNLETNTQSNMALTQQFTATNQANAQQAQQQLAGINNAAALQLANINNTHATLLNTSGQAQALMQSAQGAINNIANNNQMDANTKSINMAQIVNNLNNQLDVLNNISGLSIGHLVNPYVDANGNPLPGTTTTPTPVTPTPTLQPGNPIINGGGGDGGGPGGT